LRTRLGLTQRELAARLEIYPKTVSRWERGRRRPSEEMIKRIETFAEGIRRLM
jgi:transcriptional regulator with XRE-family HTH domain